MNKWLSPGDLILSDDGIMLRACLGNNTIDDCEYCYLRNKVQCRDVSCFGSLELEDKGLYFKKVTDE